MDQPLSAPTGDGGTGRCVLVETRRRVAGLSPALLRAREEARRTGRELVLLSAVDTAVTHPLALLLREAGVRWVVRDTARACDGLTGAGLDWDGAAFVETGPRPRLLPPGPGGPGALEIAVDALSPATGGLELGRTTAALARALDVRLTGWGSAEPATGPWSPADLTRAVRARMPRPASVVVVGRPAFTGVLAVDRVRTGVLERLSVVAALAAEPDPASLPVVATALAGAGARSALVSWRPGSDGTRPPRPQPTPLPLGAVVTESGGSAELLRRAGGFHLVPLPGDTGAVWVRFGVLALRDLGRFTTVLAGEARRTTGGPHP